MRKAGATSVASSRKIIQTGKGGISGTEGSYKASQRWPCNATMNVDIFELWLVGRVEKKVVTFLGVEKETLLNFESGKN